MEKVIIIIFIILIISSVVLGVLDTILTNYQKKLIRVIKEQNEILDKQNEILKENLRVDNLILIKFFKKLEEKSHE